MRWCSVLTATPPGGVSDDTSRSPAGDQKRDKKSVTLQLAPAGTPPSVITKLNKAILQAMKNPELIKKLDESGAIAIPGTPAEFATQIQQAIDRYQRIAKIAKIQID